MQIQDFDYQLPEEAIALYPPEVRGSSRLLVLGKSNHTIKDKRYKDVVECLNTGDVLVVNDTKVIPARLIAATAEGNHRELLLLEQHGKTKDHHSSLVMYRRRLKPGQKLRVHSTTIVVDEVFDNGTAKISSNKDLWELADKFGQVPLPPYMHRSEETVDRERYQTEFARQKGSVAAPTASLNLTHNLLELLKKKGVEVVTITLHVGLGTFMPIRVDDLTKHKMHQEYFEIPSKTALSIAYAKQKKRRIIAVGTTVTRTLEYASEQITKYSLDDSNPITGEADIFIYPGYKFKIIDGLLTNFHAPHSTVLMMASAFAGWDNLSKAYNHALKNNYKFLSYGDSMLII